MFLLLRTSYAIFHKGKHFWHSKLYKEAIKRCECQCFGHGRQRHGCLWQRVLLHILALSVCCIKRQTCCKYQCFGHGRQRHGCLWQLVLLHILAQYVVQRSKNAVNTSVLGMVAKGSDMNVIVILVPPTPVLSCKLASKRMKAPALLRHVWDYMNSAYPSVVCNMYTYLHTHVYIYICII